MRKIEWKAQYLEMKKGRKINNFQIGKIEMKKHNTLNEDTNELGSIKYLRI